MSAQSILEKDRCAYQEEYTSKVLKNANDYILKKRFDLGKVSELYLQDSVIYRILFKENCEIKKELENTFFEKGSNSSTAFYTPKFNNQPTTNVFDDTFDITFD